MCVFLKLSLRRADQCLLTPQRCVRDDVVQHRHTRVQAAVALFRFLKMLHGRAGFALDEDTDIIAGIETGLDTVLVLSGVTTLETCEQYPYRPRLILNGVGDIPE